MRICFFFLQILFIDFLNYLWTWIGLKSELLCPRKQSLMIQLESEQRAYRLRRVPSSVLGGFVLFDNRSWPSEHFHGNE